jgi:hypothetical protein
VQATLSKTDPRPLEVFQEAGQVLSCCNECYVSLESTTSFNVRDCLYLRAFRRKHWFVLLDYNHCRVVCIVGVAL